MLLLPTTTLLAPGQPGKFCNLKGHIIAIYCLDTGAQLTCKLNISLQAQLVLLGHMAEGRCLHKQRGEPAIKGIGHARCRPQDLCIGGRW